MVDIDMDRRMEADASARADIFAGLDDFFAGRRVLVTGHTGFKGAWLSKMLLDMGAEVHGYALEPPTDPSVYGLLGLADRMDSHIADIRDLDALMGVFARCRPQVVLHLAAQPIVRASYEDPRLTYETNVMGTVNVLECVRTFGGVESFLNVTTDKVYLNRERAEGYREDEPLDGFDPYSNSKSCSELVTHSYRNSFFADGSVPISTARAGNVIGGGDFARDRIIPDCVRAVETDAVMVVRNPHSIRPFQHVLEPLFAYLMIAQRQACDHSLSGWYNVGPDERDCVETSHLVDTFQQCWNRGLSASAGTDSTSDGAAGFPAGVPAGSSAEGALAARPFTWEVRGDGGPHEATYLKLDCTHLKETFAWRPVWDIDEAISRTVDWTRVWLAGGDLDALMADQIGDYREDARMMEDTCSKA